MRFKQLEEVLLELFPSDITAILVTWYYRLTFLPEIHRGIIKGITLKTQCEGHLGDEYESYTEERCTYCTDSRRERNAIQKIRLSMKRCTAFLNKHSLWGREIQMLLIPSECNPRDWYNDDVVIIGHYSGVKVPGWVKKWRDDMVLPLTLIREGDTYEPTFLHVKQMKL